MNYFSTIKKWILPASAYSESIKEMARDGIYGNEGIALWLGKRCRGNAEISHVIILRGPGIIKQAAYLRIDTSLLNEVTDKAIELNVSLIGQIHSHGPYHGTDLSFTDIKYGICVPYYLSVVAPDYAQRENTKITECGVHIFQPRKGFHQLANMEIAKRIIIEPKISCPVLTVGK